MYRITGLRFQQLDSTVSLIISFLCYRYQLRQGSAECRQDLKLGCDMIWNVHYYKRWYRRPHYFRQDCLESRDFSYYIFRWNLMIFCEGIDHKFLLSWADGGQRSLDTFEDNWIKIFVVCIHKFCLKMSLFNHFVAFALRINTRNDWTWAPWCVKPKPADRLDRQSLADSLGARAFW